MKKKIVVLASDGSSTCMVVHALERDHDVVRVILEDKESRGVFVKRRARRVGWWTVCGQVLFSVLVVPLENILSRNRTREIQTQYGLVDGAIDPTIIVRVRSVNEPSIIALLQKESPDVVVLHGTRIVSKEVLSAINSPFVNIHAGITPMYRGVHGGYWALADGHPELCGVTVHLVDPGIDTGMVLAQAVCVPEKRDCFVTYPHMQLGVGLDLLTTLLAQPTLTPMTTQAIFSRLWYHPTIWRYAWNYFTRCVK